MPHLLGITVRDRSAWGIAAALGIVVACSGKDKSFFDAPPVAHAGAGSGAGGSGAKAGRGGKGGGPSTAAGKGGAPIAGDAGSPGETAGAGEGGVAGTGGSGGDGARGGTHANGGMPPAGGSGGAGNGGGTTAGGSGGGELGGTAGTAGSGGNDTGGTSAAGTSALGGIGAAAGAGGTAGIGGIGATAGLGGAGAGGSSTCVPTVPPDEVCDGIDNDCQDGVDGAGVCPDGCFGATDEDHRYLLCSGIGSYTYTRMEAHSACADHADELGTTLDLVRVNSAGENAFVLGFIAAHGITDLVWNGASDSSMGEIGSTEGTWVWGSADNGATFYRDGAPVSDRYNDWAPGQPDDDAPGAGEDCAVFDPSKSWHWDDVSCSSETSTFVCEEPTH